MSQSVLLGLDSALDRSFDALLKGLLEGLESCFLRSDNCCEDLKCDSTPDMNQSVDGNICGNILEEKIDFEQLDLVQPSCLVSLFTSDCMPVLIDCADILVNNVHGSGQGNFTWLELEWVWSKIQLLSEYIFNFVGTVHRKVMCKKKLKCLS